jgi:hypothetical protein
MQGPCHSGPTRALNVMILDTPHGDLIEISSSLYGLSLFSMEVVSHHDAGVTATHRGSLSVSIGDLWLDIDKLDEAGHEGTSAVVMWGPEKIRTCILNQTPEGQKE